MDLWIQSVCPRDSLGAVDPNENRTFVLFFDIKDLHWHWLFVSLICSCFYWSYQACYRVDSLAHNSEITANS